MDKSLTQKIVILQVSIKALSVLLNELDIYPIIV